MRALSGHQLRQDRLPGRRRHGAGGADQEHEHQQRRRCDRSPPDEGSEGERDRSGRNLQHQQPAAIQDIGERPPGSANRNIGRLAATCTSATTSGFGLKLAINQPDAALYIQVPRFETTDAIQMMVKAA